MTRKWQKLGENKYAFSVDDSKAGEMNIALNTIDSKATCKIEGKEFIIKRTGFWKNTIEITNTDGQIIAKTYNEKWYANAAVLEYGGKKYKLMLHNNPLAEYAIFDGNKNVIAYGLNTKNGKVDIKITVANETADFLFDFLLWYLFVPIAAENMGDNFIFQMLTAAQ